MSIQISRIANCFGTPEDWGLSKHKHAEVQAELSDHLDCLQADEGIPAVEEVKASIEEPATRRKLAGVHLTDQVYATLNRLPTRQEWRELIFLLICYGLILLSDWLALKVHWDFIEYIRHVANAPAQPAVWKVWLVTGAWLLQGCARAAFYAGFAYSLWRAWRLGAGVMLARILQLKLIHTVLVVAAMLMFSRTLSSYYFYGFGYQVPWPAWLTAPVISGAVVLLGLAVLAFSRRRAWAVALGLVLTAVFLYSGGPVQVAETIVSKPILSVRNADQIPIPSTDQAEIERRAAKLQESWIDYAVDIPANRMSWTEYYAEPVTGVYLNRGDYTPASEYVWSTWHSLREYEPTGKTLLAGPLVSVGGGIGWLAVPIPLLGLIGFIGLVVIMGRRGLVEFVAYSTICVLAIVTTILPFFYGQVPADIFEFSARGMIATPLPGFESVLTFQYLNASWLMLVGGLVFSAGIPWLLTSLFLKPNGVSTTGPGFSDDPQAE